MSASWAGEYSPGKRLVNHRTSVTPSVDLDGLLESLVQNGWFKSPVESFDIIQLLAQSSEPDALRAVMDHLQYQASWRTDLLGHPLLPMPPLQLLSRLTGPPGLQPESDSQLALLSELLQLDLAIVLPGGVGEHQVRRYSRAFRQIDQGNLLQYPELLQNAGLVLVAAANGYIHMLNPGITIGHMLASAFQGKPFPVFSTMSPCPDIQYGRTARLLPTGTWEIIQAYRQWRPEESDAHLQGIINRLLCGVYHNAEQQLLNDVVRDLARLGHIGFPATSLQEQAGQWYLSKTLVAWLVSFWKGNMQILLQDSGTSFSQQTAGRIVQDTGKASEAVKNYGLGYISNQLFSPAFVDAGLPSVKAIALEQLRIIEMTAEIVKQFPPGILAVYGGLASRTHQLELVSGNLDRALSEAGLLPVNDIDLMALSSSVRGHFTDLFQQRMRKEFSHLNYIVREFEHHKVKTTKILIKEQFARILTIDISSSETPGYFNFSNTVDYPLPFGIGHLIVFPVIGLKAFRHQLEKESMLTGERGDTERRKEKARRTLRLLGSDKQGQTQPETHDSGNLPGLAPVITVWDKPVEFCCQEARLKNCFTDCRLPLTCHARKSLLPLGLHQPDPGDYRVTSPLRSPELLQAFEKW